MKLLEVRDFTFYLYLDGMVYFMKGMHLREFGFPRIKDE